MSNPGQKLIDEYITNVRAVKGGDCAKYLGMSGLLASSLRGILSLIDDPSKRVMGREIAISVHAEVLAVLQDILDISDDDAEEMIDLSSTLNQKLADLAKSQVQ